MLTLSGFLHRSALPLTCSVSILQHSVSPFQVYDYS